MCCFYNPTLDHSQFQVLLDRSISNWCQNGVKCVWFHLSDFDTIWVQKLIQNGFEFHHAKERTAVLLKWLPDSDSEVPPYPSLYLAVGTITINKNNEILAIKERIPRVKDAVFLIGLGLLYKI